MANPASLYLKTPPATEPVLLADQQLWMRAQQTDAENSLITDLIQAAREYVEGMTGRSGNQTEYIYNLDRFPLLPNSQYTPGNPSLLTPVLQNTWPLSASSWAIFLPRWPLIEVLSVSYTDENGDPQVLDPSAYYVDRYHEPPRIVPSNESFWPATNFNPNACSVDFLSGYTGVSPSLVPASYRTAIKVLAAHYYEHREAVGDMRLAEVPLGLESLLNNLGSALGWFLPC